MLIENFYTIVSSEVSNDEVATRIILNNDHQVFDGHFPNNPVTPGVCMIQLIKEILEDTLQENLSLIKISNVKFTALINPNVNSELVINTTFSKKENEVKIKNTCSFTDGTVALKCNATFSSK